MNKQEVFEACTDAISARMLSSEFGDGEFLVKCNETMRTITIIEPATSQALTLLDVTGATYLGGDVLDENDPVLKLVVQLPLKRS